jgi:glycosyltransferase involved in cell wall biosynthesis
VRTARVELDSSAPARAAVAPGARLAAVILTHNEEANLPACLNSLEGLPCARLLVDSGSTDHTLDLAHTYAADVLVHPFATHVQQWGWALDQLPRDVDWVLGLDADQRLSPVLLREIISLFTTNAAALNEYDGFYLNRKQIFRGRWIRHGGYYPKFLLKLFRRDAVVLDPRDRMDHHFYVRGRTATLRGHLLEDNSKERDLSFWLTKHLAYARLHAEEELLRRAGDEKWPITPSFTGTPDQRTAWFKQRWYGLPLYVRPLLYFGYRYFLRLGFLDGKEGFIFHLFQGFWYRLLVDVYLDGMLKEYRRGAANPAAPGPESLGLSGR